MWVSAAWGGRLYGSLVDASAGVHTRLFHPWFVSCCQPMDASRHLSARGVSSCMDHSCIPEMDSLQQHCTRTALDLATACTVPLCSASLSHRLRESSHGMLYMWPPAGSATCNQLYLHVAFLQDDTVGRVHERLQRARDVSPGLLPLQG